MAEYNDEQFKTTLMGGYDKDDVQYQFKSLKDTLRAEIGKLKFELEEKEKLLNQKNEELAAKTSEVEKLKKDIAEKYQSYIDNYDTIGQIIYDTRITSDKTIKDANEKSRKIISEAEQQAKDNIDRAQVEVDRKIADGKRRYSVLQEEISELILLVNQVQHKFMQSFKAIHKISGSIADEEDGGSDFDSEGFEEEP